jgi:hypothetical protein
MMLASKALIPDATKRIADEDVPPDVRPLWQAIKTERAENVRGVLVSYGLPVETPGKVPDALLKVVAERAVTEYAKTCFAKGQASRLLDGGAPVIAEFLEKMAVGIQAKLEKLK